MSLYHQTLTLPRLSPGGLFVQGLTSSGQIITGQEYNEYLPGVQMENYNLEDNQSLRSNLSLIQVAPTPTFATGN